MNVFSKLPSWVRGLLPQGYFYVTEKAWNFYPYVKNEYSVSSLTQQSCILSASCMFSLHFSVVLFSAPFSRASQFSLKHVTKITTEKLRTSVFHSALLASRNSLVNMLILFTVSWSIQRRPCFEGSRLCRYCYRQNSRSQVHGGRRERCIILNIFTHDILRKVFISCLLLSHFQGSVEI